MNLRGDDGDTMDHELRERLAEVARLLTPLREALDSERVRVDALRLALDADTATDELMPLADALRDAGGWLGLEPGSVFRTLGPKRLRLRRALLKRRRVLRRSLSVLQLRLEHAVHRISEHDPVSRRAARNAARAYSLALEALAQAIAPMRAGRGRSTAFHQVLQLLRPAVPTITRLAGLPADALHGFDEAHYLAANPDVRDAVAARQMRSGLEHYAVRGIDESRPTQLDTAVVEAVSLPTHESAAGDRSALPREIKRFANPGAGFEEAEAGTAPGLAARAKTIAFYLPQFHAFEQNDRWWGKGFSEWRNVARGTPRFTDHYQPRIPRDLGFYDLNDESVLHEQARLARANGIEAFCFYYYWFDGERLMERPLDRFLEAGVDQDFCIMWANENWTRTWDGFDSEVLIEQSYREEDEDGFIADTARYMGAERYVRVDGRPLFILYRPGLLPEAKATLARWRAKWTRALGVEPWILMVQGFGDTDPREYGLDGAVEFPPHKVCVGLPDINEELELLDADFSGHVRRYSDVVAASLEEEEPEFPLIKTVVPHWDNDARREGRGMALHGSTPALYERWLDGAIERAVEQPFAGEPIVFVNAWNEWAEGAYLEPDVHYGHAYLNATRRAVYGLGNVAERRKLLLVGHDAYRHGAQMLLLNIARTCARQFGLEVEILLKGGGPLLPAYREVARTRLVSELGEGGVARYVRESGVTMAVCNTSVTGDVVEALSRAGVRTVSLIHELPRLIEEYALEESVRSIASRATHVVFPSEIVAEGFRGVAGSVRASEHLRPQGSYFDIRRDDAARDRLRAELGIAADEKLVLNVGYADLRKGFDRFLEVARRSRESDDGLHFAWVGALSADMRRWVAADGNGCDRLHLIGHSDAMQDWYSAADLLFLTSREDPYPTVVLEAMNVGLPFVVFGGATGFDALAVRHGRSVAIDDTAGTLAAVRAELAEDDEVRRNARIAHVHEHCRMDDYCFHLLQLLEPSLQKVSVVVPNFDYAHYLDARLSTLFAQSYPVFETIVLDDGSTDDSVAVIERAAARHGRDIRLVPSASNGGNAFAQWSRGAELARGERVWIAEADDLAQPDCLAALAGASGANVALAFCDSAQIDGRGRRTAASYRHYLDRIDPDLFAGRFQLDGTRFVQRAMAVRNPILNASAVLWSRDALAQALQRRCAARTGLALVGDWLLYLDVLLEPGVEVVWLPEPLNLHRRHAASVTGRLSGERHLDEIRYVHDWLGERLDLAPETTAAMAACIAELERQFGLSAPVHLPRAA